MKNTSMVTEFLLSGFSGPWKLRLLQASIFMLMYLSALMANSPIITVTSLDPCFHTPVYLFLRNLSLSDLCLISAVVPKSVVNSLTQNNSIALLSCATQVFLVVFSAAAETFLLTAMFFDRYAAIGHPLHYEVIMNRNTCVQMAAVSWLNGGFMSLLHTVITFSLSYCGLNEIQQFFCDIPQLLAVSCSDHMTAEIVLIFINVALDLCCFTGLIISYIYIFSTIRNIPSTQGQTKAYSTCLPYLTVVALFLSTAFTAYLKPILGSTSFTDLILSAFYILLPPFFNPVIYSLRNKAMKTCLEKLITRKLLKEEKILTFIQE
ncbi:olfactory receptor 14A16-like [Choloepus didactylus]|uniref:olfactory receptor 14A16-like n=1 Tax=Choloepus didactylus TaxID=27675 RepID=UPI00189FBD20|nr:olfactory receptor 14A16-like [Choloepus didactylus]